jgi:hypothetical protein
MTDGAVTSNAPAGDEQHGSTSKRPRHHAGNQEDSMLARTRLCAPFDFAIRRTLPILAAAALAGACTGEITGDGTYDDGLGGGGLGDWPGVPPGGEQPGDDGPGEPPDVSATCVPGAGTDYEVGPGQAYENISDVPWEQVSAGDTVRIHWREQPYAEKFAIAGQGTADQPIRVCGIPGSGGQLPTITGANATTRASIDYGHPVLEELGIVLVSRPDYHEAPSHVVIEGLHVTGAHDGYTFRDVNGQTRPYSPAAACIRVQEGDHITLRGNMITDCGNGLFVISKPENESKLTKNLLVEGNYLQDNGVVGSDRQHSSYIQAVGATYQYNYFGRPRAGSMGGNVKDRSAGLVFRYNWVEGGKRILDIVEAEDYGPWVMEEAYLEKLGGASPDPARLAQVKEWEKLYRQSYVYGNFLKSVGSTDAAMIVHYGHDSVPRYTRKGTLWFYNNTVVLLFDQPDAWKTRLMDLSTAAETAEVFNNIVHIEAETPGQTRSDLFLTRYDGVVKLGTNWVTEGWLQGGGQIEGAGNLIGGGGAPVDLDTLLPVSGSPVIDAAQQMNPGIPAEHGVTREYAPPTGSRARAMLGSAEDLGAAEIQ